jgi:hypothetical protein
MYFIYALHISLFFKKNNLSTIISDLILFNYVIKEFN